MGLAIPRNEVYDLIEQRFPMSKLLEMSIELTERGQNPEYREQARELVREITTKDDYDILKSIVMQIDVKVPTPRGEREILHGSCFYFPDFQVMEDPNLNQALKDYLEYQYPTIGRSDFSSALMCAAILAGTVVIQHDLTEEKVDKIVKEHLLTSLLYYGQQQLSREGAPLLLYGCLKVVAHTLAERNE